MSIEQGESSAFGMATEAKQDDLIAISQALLAASGGAPAQTKRDWSGDDLIYKGTNTSTTAAESDATWSITKFTYVGGVETATKTLTGSWTGRVALFA